MIKNQKGQLIVEMVLILVLLFSVVSVVGREFKRQELLGQLVSGPWVILSGMIQNGTWKKAKDSMQDHPNVHVGRHNTPEGDGYNE